MSGPSDRPSSPLESFSTITIPGTETPSPPPMSSPASAAPPPPPHRSHGHATVNGQATAATDISGSNYARERRELLNLLANLHRTGIQQVCDFNLPQIAVVGSQSVGKSSLIEAISGIKLPRQSGTCTRCPMECRLEYSPSVTDWTCRVSLRMEGINGVQEIEFGAPLYDPNDVEQRLRLAQLAVLHPQMNTGFFLDPANSNAVHSLTGGRSFTDDCVSLHIVASNVTDLHFFDLPGIIVNVQDGQDPADIELVRNMVRRYIERSGCIKLLVVSCETDFENQVACRLVKEVDPLGRSTVGVLTKPDRTDAESAREAQRIGAKYPLRSGWFVLKLPSSTELQLGITQSEAQQNAKLFFRNSDLWRDYARTNAARIGTANLTEYLAQRLSDQLRQELPRIRQSVKQTLVTVMEDIASLPATLTTDPIAEVFGRVTKLTNEVREHVGGSSPLETGRRGLVQQLLALYGNFKEEIRATVPVFDARKPSLEMSWGRESAQDVQLNDLDADGETRSIRTRGAIRIEEVMRTAKEARTRELPGNIPFAVKKHYIDRFLSTWMAPTAQLFNDVLAIYGEEVDKVVRRHFEAYEHGGLLDLILEVVALHIQECAKEAMDGLQLAVKRETELTYTQNTHYLDAYKAKYLAHYRHARTTHVPSPPSPSAPAHIPAPARATPWARPTAPAHSATPAHPVSRPASPARSIPDAYEEAYTPASEVLEALRRYSVAYSNVTATDLPKLLRGDTMDPAIDIIAEVRAYFQVAYIRFIDNIPAFIEQSLIRSVDAKLSNAVYEGLGLFEGDARRRCTVWVAEPPVVAERRNDLLAQSSALVDAQRLLQQFG